MTRAVVLGGSRWWLAGAAAVALALFATTAFGQDGSLVAQGKRVFNDQGCYGCHTMDVLGTHGRGGLDRALLGSVADRVIRLAPCLVLTVRETG